MDGDDWFPRLVLIHLDDRPRFPQCREGLTFGLRVVTPGVRATRGARRKGREKHSTHVPTVESARVEMNAQAPESLQRRWLKDDDNLAVRVPPGSSYLPAAPATSFS